MGRTLKFIIEALLFASEKPLSPEDINKLIPEETLSDIKNALRELQDEYQGMGRSFTLKQIAQGYQFRTLSEYSPYIQRISSIAPIRLSKAALETLSIIAYKQPVLRQEIERLRGVDTGGILRTLIEKELVRILGRKNLPGRPLIYGTTKKFLEVFDLDSLDSLPKLKEIEALESNEEDSPPKPSQAASPGNPHKDNTPED